MKKKKKKKKLIKCSACNGLGNVDEAVGFELDCLKCGGTGKIEK